MRVQNPCRKILYYFPRVLKGVCKQITFNDKVLYVDYVEFPHAVMKSKTLLENGKIVKIIHNMFKHKTL